MNQQQQLCLYGDDEEAKVIALSVEEITAEKNFSCEFCNKKFNREQNLQLHKRAHNIPFTLENDKNEDGKRKVYLCPETTCANHNRCYALGNFTSLKKHYKRKHSEKTLDCPKCYKKYAVEADLRAHLKTCGTKEYKCECGSGFSRRDSYITHRTLCDALVKQQFSKDTTRTSQGNLFGQTIFDNCCSHPTNTAALSAGFTTSDNLLPSLDSNILTPPYSSLRSSPLYSNQSEHWKIITPTNPGNNSNAQGSEFVSDSNFDVNVLYDRLFAVSSAPSTALPQEAPQQGYSLANPGNSASFTRNMKNSTGLIASSLDTDNSHIYPDFSSAASGNSHFSVFQSNISSYVPQNGCPPQIAGDGQFNQEQFRGSNNGVGGNANFPELQNDFGWGY
ncbi:Protein indeterminate-domain 12 [Heracleum sosnowskyi]|uniref:Protein indeterminate-domain 12 n=1 Tax=Heracleum sosnowskyi TaxID=360622 RepID=A0AAD8N867_9APIA|nr:Protein indeterminate-domain 12 [Heracleum sosnowskyi]